MFVNEFYIALGIFKTDHDCLIYTTFGNVTLKNGAREMERKLEELYNRLAEAFSKIISAKQFKIGLPLAIALFVVILMSGLLYCISNPTAAVIFVGGVVRVFIPDYMMQTYGELFVMFTYYLMALIGVVLYIMAGRESFLGRRVKYMYIFSFILLLIAFVGILLALQAKIG